MKLRKYFIAIAIIIGLVILFRVVEFGNGYTVMITTPDYNGDGGDSYMVKSYYEENGCVTFTDMLGVNRKICGEYYINDYSKK